MLPVRTDAELVAAIEAMYRIRAVESPPDAKGQRTIWHRASRNAELVSWVDADGRVVRQELMLFDDVLIWERGAELKTGAIVTGTGRANKPSDSMTLDDSVVEERVARFGRGLGAYGGEDRFIAHARDLVKPPDLAVLGFENQITRPSHEVLRAISSPALAAVEVVPERRVLPMAALAVGVGLVLVAVAMLLIFWK